jgi:hypothetical protein
VKEHIARLESARDSCFYCGRSLKRTTWKPFHLREVLYLTSYCTCGKKAVVRLPFLGSGHGAWNGNAGVKLPRPQGRTRIRTLESTLKIIEKK